MADQRHIVFFGASVTEQDRHSATGEITGYVTCFAQDHAPGLGLRVSRVAAGSSDISDAALVYVEDVIALAPDICVLDWATPALRDCDPRHVAQVYLRLLAHDILPVTVIWPRTDRVQRDQPLVREMAAQCRAFGLPFHDMTFLLDMHGAGSLLRDVVHTTAAGAVIYARVMADLIAGLASGAASDLASGAGTGQSAGQSLRLPIRCLLPAPFVVSEPVAAQPPPDSFRKLTILRDGRDDTPVEFCVMMQQRVGPWSPVLDVRTFGDGGGKALPAYSLWDPWCTRERQALKKLMHWHRGPLRRIELSVSRSDPPYGSVPGAVAVDYADRRIRQRGRLFVVSDRPVACRVSYG